MLFHHHWVFWHALIVGFDRQYRCASTKHLTMIDHCLWCELFLFLPHLSCPFPCVQELHVLVHLEFVQLALRNGPLSLLPFGADLHDHHTMEVDILCKIEQHHFVHHLPSKQHNKEKIVALRLVLEVVLEV